MFIRFKKWFRLFFVLFIVFLMCSCVSRGRKDVDDLDFDEQDLEEFSEVAEGDAGDTEFQEFSEEDIEALEEDEEEEIVGDENLGDEEGSTVVSEFDEESKSSKEESLDFEEDFEEDLAEEGEDEQEITSSEDEEMFEQEKEIEEEFEDQLAQVDETSEETDDEVVQKSDDLKKEGEEEEVLSDAFEDLEEDEGAKKESVSEGAEEDQPKKLSVKAQDQLKPSPFGDTKTILNSATLDDFLFSKDIQYFGKKISIEVKDGDIRDVIKFITLEQGLNVVLSQEVQGRVTLKLQKVPWDQVLVVLMRMQKLSYIRYGNVMQIALKSSIDQELQAIKNRIKEEKGLMRQQSEEEVQEMLEKERFEEEAMALIEEEKKVEKKESESEEVLKLKIIPLNFSRAEKLEDKVKELLEKGSITSVKRTNSLIIKDTEEAVERISQLVRALDTPPYQVRIRGKFIESSKEFTREMGLNLAMAQPSGSLFDPQLGDPIQLEGGFSIQPTSEKVSTLFGANLRVGIFKYLGNLDARLKIAEEEKEISVISKPIILTLDNQEAIIRQKGENLYRTYIRESTGTGATTEKISRSSLILELKVKPQVSSNQSILLDVEIKREFPGPPLGQSNATPINTRNAKTQMLIRSGDTAVIGGIYQKDFTNSETGVPILKDIPIIGWLFKYFKKVVTENELLIFLTPEIVAYRPDVVTDDDNSEITRGEQKNKEVLKATQNRFSLAR